MSEYTIKSNKIGEGMYNQNIFDGKGNLMKEDAVLENGMTVKDTLYYCSISMVPFMRRSKIETLESKMEITGK